MKFGLFLGSEYPARRSMAPRVNALIEQVRLASSLGFDCALAGQHYLSYPVQILQPTPLLGRLAAEAGDMWLGTGIVLLPLQHPVDMAEQVATLDQITGGKFIFGVGLGYEKEEFEAFGLDASQRAGRFEESLAIIKRLWTEDEVHFEGAHFSAACAALSVACAEAASARMDRGQRPRARPPSSAPRRRVVRQPARQVQDPRRADGHLPGSPRRVWNAAARRRRSEPGAVRRRDARRGDSHREASPA